MRFQMAFAVVAASCFVASCVFGVYPKDKWLYVTRGDNGDIWVNYVAGDLANCIAYGQRRRVPDGMRVLPYATSACERNCRRGSNGWLSCKEIVDPYRSIHPASSSQLQN